MRLSCLLLNIALAAACLAAEDDEVVVGPLTLDPQEQFQRFGQMNFDQMLYQNDGNATVGEQRLRARVDLQLAEIDRVCQLSDAQKAKLQLAIRGDLQRFFSEAALLRIKFDKLMKEKGNDANGFNNEVWQQMWQDIQPLQMRMMRGLTEAQSSLLKKVLRKTLTSEQLREYDALIAERMRFRYEASIAVTLHNLEEVVALSGGQREALTRLLLEMTPPRQSGQYDMYLVLFRLGALPTEKLEPLFAPAQWKSLKAHIDQYRGVQVSWVEAGIIEQEDVVETWVGAGVLDRQDVTDPPAQPEP
jgi:hypothetical protein